MQITLYNISMDKRVIRTKENIKTAFMQLMLESNLDKITVSEITNKAKVNRSTFYLHYSDVSAVIVDIEREFAERISVCIEKFDITDIYGSICRMFTQLSDALENNRLAKRYLIYSTDAVSVTNRLKLVLVERTAEALAEEFPTLNTEKLTYPLTFAAAGIIETYVRWVKNEDKSPVSLGELIKEVSVYTENIISHITAEN